MANRMSCVQHDDLVVICQPGDALRHLVDSVVIEAGELGYRRLLGW